MALHRHLAIPLHRAAHEVAPLLVQGPRGSGKTTLLRQELPGHVYIDLNERADRAAARRDPQSFLARLGRPAVIDELQAAPELVQALSILPLRLPIVFSSSVRLPLQMETLELHPPTRAERQRRPPMPFEILGRFAPSKPASQRAPEAEAWPATRDWIDKDVPLLVKLDQTERFEALVDLVEKSSGSLLHQQELARELGVAHRTVVRWLEVLDSCFLTLRLEPLDLPLGRRLVRRPKLHYLPSSASFETETVSEIYRNARHSALNPVLRYWRDSNGLEVPLILQDEPGGTLIPVGISSAPNPADEARLQRWMKLAGVHQGAMIGRDPALLERRKSHVLRYAIGQL